MHTDAAELVRRLSSSETRIVLAESCTGGLVAAELAKIPGVSEWLCGSAVVYRYDTKARWLGVRRDDLERFTAVSSPVANQMAAGVLEHTPEAQMSISVTGHLGPNAPEDQDGIAYTAIARREKGIVDVLSTVRHELESKDREARQIEAMQCVIRRLLDQFHPQS